MQEQQYAGFWIRAFALIIDSVLMMVIMTPIMMMMGVGDSPEEMLGTTYLLLNLLFIAIFIAFWVYKGATPGKMLTKTKIVDADTGENLSWGKAILRYIGYIPSTLIFFLGYIWVAFDSKKQGWHDKIANCVVIKTN